MDHREIEDHDVVERYLEDALAGDEEARFEEHLLECAECFERVRWDDDLGRSLRAAAAEDVVRATVGAGLAARFGRRLGVPLVLGLLVVAAIPSALLLRERARGSRLSEPQINTPIYALGAARDATDVTTRVTLGPSPEWIVLKLEPAYLEHRTYRATLEAAGGVVVWQRQGLEPDANDALVISVHSTSLRPGDFVLRLEGLTAAGETVAAGEFPFRVVENLR